MLYIKRFDTLPEQTAYLAEVDIDTYVGYVDENQTVYYDDSIVIQYQKKYLTIEALTAGDLSLTGARSNFNYSLDNGSTWNVLTNNQTVAVNAGEKVLLKANRPYADYSTGIGNIKYSGQFNLYGNIMSLVYGDDFIGQETISDFYQFYKLFSGATTLISAENLILSATTLKGLCYNGMFRGCTSLTTVPELPATTLADYCYGGMFLGCTSLTVVPELPATTLAKNCYAAMFEGTSLTTPPELPATTLANECYSSMFRDCKKLTTAPELPATTLAQNCYYQMFRGCTNLNYIKCLATDISARNCTAEWVYGGVASSGTFVKAASMNDWTTGNNGIPSGWTVQNE